MTDPTAYQALIDSWELALDAENKSPRTIDTYLEGMRMFLRWLDDTNGPEDPADITTAHCRAWLAHLVEQRSPATARTRWAALRQFWAWCHAEEEIPGNPMIGVKPPAVPEQIADMLTLDQLKTILDSCEGPRMVDRRDTALIMLYADTGARLSEIARAQLPDLDLRGRTVRIVAKGRRERLVPFGARTARAVDRYLRIRGRQKYASTSALWLSGKDGRALTPKAVQQMMVRRGAAVGIRLHTHMLRHGFADAWLRAGGSEGDLMELGGWQSRQMLTRYAAATRAERAREAYQKLSPMDRL